MLSSPLLTKFAVYFLLVLVGVLGAIGDIAVLKWSKTWRLDWWVASCVLWIIVASLFGWLLGMKQFNFGIAVILALLCHSGCALLYDVQFNGAKLDYVQWLGVVSGIITLCLLR